jgi:hypothetical protein
MHDHEDQAKAEQSIQALTKLSAYDWGQAQALVARIGDAWELFRGDWQYQAPSLPKTLLCLSGALEDRVSCHLANERTIHALRVYLKQRPGRFRTPTAAKAAQQVARLVQRRMGGL